MKTNLLVVLLNWNGNKFTQSCYESLLKLNNNEAVDILILDNFSELNDYDLLKSAIEDFSGCVSQNPFQNNYSINELFIQYQIDNVKCYRFRNDSQIFLARSSVNHGFSRGCNFGALVAENLSYKYIMLLNNDTVVEPDSFENLFLHIDHYDILIPQIRYFEPNTKIWNCGGEVSRFGKRTYYYAGKDVNSLKLPKKPFTISFATGCCMLMKTSFFVKSGMFTEDFFFGEEDIDYALRLIKKNSKIACVPESIIYHKVGASLSGDIVKLKRKAFVHFLNRFINMKKHLGIFWAIWLLPAFIKTCFSMLKIYKLSILQSFSFSLKVLTESIKRNKVDKDYFEKIIREGY